MKKSPATQEMVNIYPPQARVKQDQSVGYQFLNATAQPMDDMSQQLRRMRDNFFLTTANLDEIDLTYRVTLPATFNFDQDTTDPAGDEPIVPTVSGLLDGTWYDIDIALDNDIRSFWYDSIPDRASLSSVVSGVNHELTLFTVSGMSVSGLWEHHIDGGGSIFVEASGTGKYLDLVDDELRRARVTLFGTSRQGLEEDETLVFPWPLRQKSLKDWDIIERIEPRDVPDDVQIILTSANFEEDDYISFWNDSYSENRNKIDEFWGLGTTTSGSTLDRIGYVSDEWQHLALGFTEKEAKESWELLDATHNPVTVADMALQPFTDNVWTVTPSGMLYCYEAISEMPSGLDNIKARTAGSNVQIDVEPRWVLLGEDIDFIPWYARPLQDLIRYRIWYQTPSGAKYGLSDGVPVSFTSNFWVSGRQLKRTIENLISITTTERGEYTLVLEAQLDDGTTHTDKVIVSVNHKLPKATIDISSLVPDLIQGIDFDSDQALWVKTSDDYYKINLHTDIMLIDYNRKIIYFKEPYESVEVITSG